MPTLAIFQLYRGVGLLVFNIAFINWLIFCVLTPLSAIFQLYHGNQF